MSTPRQELQKPGKLTPSRITDLLWETAVESFVRAILVLVMGSLALGLVGGLLKDMVPSLPPGLAPEAIAPEAQMHGGRHEWHYFQSHRLAIVFTLLFLVSASLRLAHYAPVEAVGRTTLRIRAVGRRLGDEWFGLIALNAIGAFVSTMVIFWVQRFSLPQMVYQSVLAIVGNYLEAIGQFLFGESGMSRVTSLFAWYGSNQFRFTFWLLYFAAICDDLGLPNLKTLGRWAWSRTRQKLSQYG